MSHRCLATIEPSRASGSGSKTTAPLLGRGPTFRSDDIDLPEPPRSFCLGCGLAEGRVVIAWHRQFVPALGMTLFCDAPCDGNPAGPIQEAVRHGFLQSLESVSQLVQPSQTDRPVQAPRVKLPAISFPPALSSASS